MNERPAELEDVVGEDEEEMMPGYAVGDERPLQKGSLEL